MIRLFVIASALILFASSSKVSLVQSEVPPDTVITLERTICFGSCPMYTLTVKANGSVSFQPRYVEDRAIVSGPLRHGSISKEKIKELLSEFERVNYFSLKDSYKLFDNECQESWSDHPSAITSLTLNGKFKSVNHDYGCQGPLVPASLTELEKKIDEIANTKQWLK